MIDTSTSSSASELDRVYPPKMLLLLRLGAALGLVIFLALPPLLLVQPRLGLQILWFASIPVAPMFLLAAPNAWVSLCPVSTLQSLPRRLGWKRGIHLRPATSRRLQLLGWVLMLTGIPSRHLVFNTDGPGVMAAASLVTLIALGIGLACASLSGWCAGACPIRPVEVIYGQFARDRNRPEKCTTCDGCVAHCVRIHPDRGARELGASDWITNFVYGVPGFVAAYFALDLLGLCTSEQAFFRADVAPPPDRIVHALTVYGLMAAGFVFSWTLFGILGRLGISRTARFELAAITAYCCYYLGVVPEIVIVWNLPPVAGWFLMIPPLAVLMFVLFWPRRGPEPVLTEAVAEAATLSEPSH